MEQTEEELQEMQGQADVEIQAAQARLLRVRESVTNLVSLPLPSFLPELLNANGKCLRCGASLTQGRMIQCEECDAFVEIELLRIANRDRLEQLSARLRQSGLPLDYRDGVRDLQNLPVALRAQIVGIMRDGARGIFLHGPAGSYKTSAAAAYLADQIHEGHSGRYVFVPDLMSDVHASYRSDETESRDQIVSRCANARLLVLDDLGKEKASEHAAGVIFEILDYRYRNHRPGDWTIATSNYDLDALCARFPNEELAEPIRRRLSELTVAVPMVRP